MKFESTDLPGDIGLVPTVHGDSRGFFMDSSQARIVAESRIDAALVQKNFSHSRKDTLRGPHCQIQLAKGKPVRVRPGNGVRGLSGSQTR